MALLRRLGLLGLVLASLPILLSVYQPGWQLGGVGIGLGVIGMTLSPLVLFGVLLLWVRARW